jgi:hypothetical protein
MGFCPLYDEGLRAARQLPLQYLQRSDIDERFVFRVESVKMGWRVIVPEHLDQNTIKDAQRWQDCFSLYRQRSMNGTGRHA